GIELKKVKLAVPFQKIAIQITAVRQYGSDFGNQLSEQFRGDGYRLVSLSGTHGQLFLGSKTEEILILAIQQIHTILRPLDYLLNDHRAFRPKNSQGTFRDSLAALLEASLQLLGRMNDEKPDRRAAPT